MVVFEYYSKFLILVDSVWNKICKENLQKLVEMLKVKLQLINHYSYGLKHILLNAKSKYYILNIFKMFK